MRVRATQAKVRKSIFDVLSGQVSGKLVIDIFAGIGSIGIEALNRDAKKVIFVEKDKKLVSTIRNILKIRLAEERGEVWAMDAFRVLPILKKKGFLFDIFFADPPYNYKHTEEFLDCFFASGILADKAKGVIEHSRHLSLPDMYPRTNPSFKKWKEKRFGETVLTFYQGSQN